MATRVALEPRTRNDGDPYDWWPMLDQEPTRKTYNYVAKWVNGDKEEALKLLLHVFPDWRPWRST